MQGCHGLTGKKVLNKIIGMGKSGNFLTRNIKKKLIVHWLL